jgi:FkbM family methyltransferase
MTFRRNLASGFWFVRTSLTLDVRFWRRRDLPARMRLSFLGKKYALIVRHRIRPFSLGHDSVTVSGERIFYDSPFGIAGYQRVLTTTQHLLDIAGIRSANVVVDVGANVGFFSLMAGKRFPGARIVAIEPVPQIFDCLAHNLGDRPNTVLLNVAVSDSAETVQMSFSPMDSAVSKVTSSGEVLAEARTLDDVAQECCLETVDLLKVDTETFEAHVLRGARRVLESTRFILIEVTIEGNTNYTMSSLCGLLSSSTFDFQLVAFRNFADKGEGEAPVLDCLFENVALTRSSSGRVIGNSDAR